MTLWRPDPALIRRPAYLSLADQFARAVHDGRLANGERLPTHRALADELKLSVQTVSRAYEELIRRGLVVGEIGRGSFVQTPRREPDPPYLPERPGEVVDLSILKPVCEPMHLDLLKQALAWLSEALPASSALSFRPNMVFPRHRAVAAEWLRICGLEVSPQNITLTNGATAGMTVALMSVAPPGSTVATEAIGHHTLVPLARYLGFNLEGLPIDDDGIVPEALDEACRHSDIRAVFVQPSVINPTATLMGAGRREEIADFLRRARGKKFEEQRQIVRQFLCIDLETGVLIHPHEIDHGLSAIAALAMDMLEDVQRKRPRAVEELHIALLRLIEIAVADEGDQAVGQPAQAGRKIMLAIQRRFQFRLPGLQFGRGIGQQQRKNLQGLVHHACSRKISVGVWTTFRRFAPNRSSVDVPPEQPLPKLNPQDPRTS